MSKAESENTYEEYVYEEYAALSNRDKNANSNLYNKKLIKIKWCIIFVVLSFSIGALVGSLSMYLMPQNDAPIATTASTTSTTTTASITTPASRLFIYSNAVIASLKFNNVLYGRPNGGMERIIEFEPNEVVEEFQYHKTAWWWVGTLCSFAIKTNVKTYNVDGFEEWEAKNTERYGYCGKQQLFSVKVSSNEDLNSFFNTELVIGESKGNRDRGTNWILGFKSETVVETK